MNIKALDLNLLRVLDALFQERSVSLAAERLGLSQPAVSNALRRLREALGDPLFVRGAGEMMPTSRAEALERPVRQALAEIEQALSGGPGFDPASISEPILIGAADEEINLFGPALVKALDAAKCSAPVQFLPLDRQYRADTLWRHRLSCTLSTMIYAPEGLKQRKLYDEHLICLIRADHPDVDHFDLDAYLSSEHLLIAPLGGTPQGIVDTLLQESGRLRRIRTVSHSFSAAPVLVLESGLVATLPYRRAARHPFGDSLAIRPLPLNLPPYSIHMFWSERYDRDPANIWLRDLMATVSARI